MKKAPFKARFLVWHMNRKVWAAQRANTRFENYLEDNGITENGYTYHHELKGCTAYEILEPAAMLDAIARGLK